MKNEKSMSARRSSECHGVGAYSGQECVTPALLCPGVQRFDVSAPAFPEDHSSPRACILPVRPPPQAAQERVRGCNSRALGLLDVPSGRDLRGHGT